MTELEQIINNDASNRFNGLYSDNSYLITALEAWSNKRAAKELQAYVDDYSRGVYWEIHDFERRIAELGGKQ